MTYLEVENRRAMLRALKARLDASEHDVLDLQRQDIATLGAETGLGARESVRLLKRLLEERFIRVVPAADGLYTQMGSGFLLVQVEDLTDWGLREIGVLPPALDSVDGLLSALQELAGRIEADPTLPEREKGDRADVVRHLSDEIRRTAVTIGAKELMEHLARVFT